MAIMQWELTLVEHESKFSEVVADSVKTAAMRAMLPKDVLERVFDGPFQYEELRNRVSAKMGEKLAGLDSKTGAQPLDTGQIDKSEGEDEDVNAVQQRRPHDRSNLKHKQESDNERKPSIAGLPTHHHQRHVNRLHVTRNPGVMRRSRVRGKRSVSSATSVVEKAILPGSARQQMIVRTWMKSEQSRPAILTVICLVWIGAMTPPRPSTQ